MLLTACTTPSIQTARDHYIKGDLAGAEAVLDSKEVDDNDKVLFLMERGSIRQALGNYEGSSDDYIEASDILEKLQVYSVSKGTASMIVNDNVQSFKGAPYERTLLHALTALNHFAEGKWNDAAVEARRIITTLSDEVRGSYPEQTFSRYIAGFALQINDDPSNAAIQFQKASDNASDISISPTGQLAPTTTTTNGITITNDTIAATSSPCELVCFALLGNSMFNNSERTWITLRPSYVEISSQGTILGRTYQLTDTSKLKYTTDQLEATRKAAKTIGRIALKEGIAQGIESSTDNEALGALARIILIGLLEQPDLRQWETLPHWLQVARIPCPCDLSEYDADIKNSYGHTIKRIHVTSPITRHRNTYVSFFRDLPTYTNTTGTASSQ